MTNITENDLFLFIGENPRSYSDLLKFANCYYTWEGKLERDKNRPFISKNTLIAYKLNLQREGRIQKRLGLNGIEYFVPKEFEKEVEWLRSRNETEKYLDEMTLEEIKRVLANIQKNGTRIKLGGKPSEIRDKNGNLKGYAQPIVGGTYKTLKKAN